MNPSQPYPWRLYWVLLVTEVLAALAIAPIVRDMLAGLPVPIERPPIPLFLLVLIGAVQNLVLMGITLWLGLKLSRALGLRMPLIEHWVGEKSLPSLQAETGERWSNPTPNPSSQAERRASVPMAPIVSSGLLVGLIIGIILVGCLLLLTPRLPNLPFVIVSKLPVWKRFLACFYGGVYEELFTRLFLLSVIAWLMNRSWRKPKPQLSNTAFWLANILTALLFGLGHLPSASLFMPITALVVVAALLLNGIAGIAFGYLFRTRGLEAAMVAHFTADFVIYVVGASLLRQGQ
jgi:membrane protease YdiL (CAAX protease family)